MKKMDPGKAGRWGGPPWDEWAEWEKIAILRAQEEIPRFPDAEEVGLKAMALLLSWRKSQRNRVVCLEQRKEGKGRTWKEGWTCEEADNKTPN